MKKYGIIACFLVMLTACTDPRKEVINELKKETIAVHDEVMPRMGELMELSSDMKKIREQVVLDSADSAGDGRLVYTEQIMALEQAHEAMMQWMADYQPDYEQSHQLDSAIHYYQEQREAIYQVKQSVEISIEDAQYLKKAQ